MSLFAHEPRDPEQSETASRILEAAGVEFAEHGFRSARVRDIVARAGVNLAAINYYFGGKEGLYLATLRHHARQALTHHPIDPDALEKLSPEAALHAAIHNLLARFIDPHSPTLIGRLIAREMTNPTAVLDQMVEEFSRPQFGFLQQVIGRVIGRRADEELLARCAASVFGQCVVFLFARPVVERLHPELLKGDRHLERMADHIHRFSLAALQGIATTLESRT
jgi:AcrR family transcriptional regulator